MTDSSSQMAHDPIGSELVREDASFADIVVQFVEGLDGRLKTMEDAIRVADFEALRVAAHQLKGSGGGYGYPALTDCAAELERHAKGKAIEECTAAFDGLQKTVARVVVDPAPPAD